MSSRRGVRLLAWLVPLALALTACGGDEPDEPADPGTETETEAAEEPTDDGPTETEAAEPSGEPIRIGMLTSLTGPFTPWGVQVQTAMRAAVEDVNAAGGVDGRPLELVEADDQNNPDLAVTELQRMVEQDGVVGVGGVISSDVGLASARAAEELGIPLFLVKAGAAPILGAESRFTFRTCLPAAPMVAGPIAQYIEAEGQTRVGAIIADYAWGQSIGDALEETIGALDGVELQIETAPITEQDFTTYLRRLDEFEPDIIVATGHPPGAGPISVQAADLGIDVPVTGAWTPLNLIVGALGDVAYDRYSDFACADYFGDSYAELARGLIERTDLEFVSDDAVAGNAIVHLLAESAAAAGDDPAAIAEHLHANSFDMPGYAHPLSWTEWGELAESQPTFVIIRQQAPPEGVNAAGEWYPELLIQAEPLDPYQPGG